MKGYAPYRTPPPDAAKLMDPLFRTVDAETTRESLAELLIRDGRALMTAGIEISSPSEFLESCGLGTDAALAVELVASTGAGNRRWVVAADRVELRGPEPVRVTRNWIVKRAELHGSLDIRGRILLLDRGTGSSPEAASLPGAILWEDTHGIGLEDMEHGYPVVIGSVQGMAPWHVDFTGPQDRLLPAGMRIVLNRSREEIWRQLESKEPDALLLEWFLGDLLLALIMDHARRQEDGEEGEEGEGMEVPERTGLRWRTVREVEESVVKTVMEGQSGRDPEVVMRALVESRKHAAAAAMRLTGWKK